MVTIIEEKMTQILKILPRNPKKKPLPLLYAGKHNKWGYVEFIMQVQKVYIFRNQYFKGPVSALEVPMIWEPSIFRMAARAQYVQNGKYGIDFDKGIII